MQRKLEQTPTSLIKLASKTCKNKSTLHVHYGEIKNKKCILESYPGKIVVFK